MHKLQRLIKSGSKSFLITEYLYLCVWVVLVFAVLIVIFSIDAAQLNATAGVRIACAFLLGAGLSAASGWFGMMVATDANIRTTWAADKDGLNSALQVAFTGGSCMGFVVSGLGLAGIAVCYIIMALGYDANTPTQAQMQSIASLTGFGFGASSIALFARVAGGIFTKVRGGGARAKRGERARRASERSGQASEAGKRAKRASERSGQASEVSFGHLLCARSPEGDARNSLVLRRRPTWAPTWSARWRPASPRTTRATPR
jgi:hypothetical protein